MAERSERVENFLFRATREYTEAGIEQATVAMRCLGANSPEPRRRTVPRSDTSALRAEDQQLYNRTSLTSWAHRMFLSKRRELVLSIPNWLSGIRFFEGPLLPWPIDYLHLPNWTVCAGVVAVAQSAKKKFCSQGFTRKQTMKALLKDNILVDNFCFSLGQTRDQNCFQRNISAFAFVKRNSASSDIISSYSNSTSSDISSYSNSTSSDIISSYSNSTSSDLRFSPSRPLKHVMI